MFAQRYMYAIQLAVACVLGLCTGEPDPTPPQCICKPIMRLEWEPTSSICNNATFDWLLQTVMAQVTRQNEDLTSQSGEIERLTQDTTSKDDYINELQRKIDDLEYHVSDLRSQNTKLINDVEDAKEHSAHSSPRPMDCADVQRYGFHYSGIYTIYPNHASDGVEVFCDLNTNGGGWLVFQRRQDGSQPFDKNWDEYKAGFGKQAKEFWLGNDMLHKLTNQREYELRIDLTDYLGKRYYAVYETFDVEGEDAKFRINLGKYDGDAGDAMNGHNHMAFSTVDQDNDLSRSGNCAELYGRGGWWWSRCYDSNLNGIYSDRHLYETIVWHQLRQNHEPMRHTEMKFRPKGF